MSEIPLIEAIGLSRYYGSHRAVQDITLTLHAGEVLGLLGPNGAGKSTTLSMICGLLAPTSGKICINGINLLDNPASAKKQIGYLPEHPPLYRDLTVDEYLKYAARLRGIKRHALNKAVALAKSRTGLEDAGDALIGLLSKGFQQRVGIAQAIVHQPAAIILDEPSVGLDPLQIREIRELIDSLRPEHGIILSTHILAEVQAVCHRVMILNNGRMVFTDTLDHFAGRESSTRLKVVFRHPPDMEELGKIAHVLSVDKLTEKSVLINHETAHSPAETIARLAVTRNWDLCELVPERTTLEQAFLDTVYDEYGNLEEITA